MQMSKCLSVWEWTTPTFLSLEMWVNHSSICFSSGRRWIYGKPNYHQRGGGVHWAKVPVSEPTRQPPTNQLCAALRTCKILKTIIYVCSTAVWMVYNLVIVHEKLFKKSYDNNAKTLFIPYPIPNFFKTR